MILPDFLIIGAARAGTTSLYHYLGEHPQIFMSAIKETNFFALDWDNWKKDGPQPTASSVKNIQEYSGLFKKASDNKVLGEASPWYFYAPDAHERIHQKIPDAKLIAILRDPSDRAFSMYMKFVRDDNEPCSDFMEAVHDKDTTVRYSWENYIEPGFYHKHIQRFLSKFDREQMKIFLYDDLCSEPAHIIREVFEFLNVDAEYLPPDLNVKYNISGVPKSTGLNMISKLNPLWHRVRGWIPKSVQHKISANAVAIKSNNLERHALKAEDRQELIGIYKDDILQLQKFLKRDLSNWLN